MSGMWAVALLGAAGLVGGFIAVFGGVDTPTISCADRRLEAVPAAHGAPPPAVGVLELGCRVHMSTHQRGRPAPVPDVT